MLRAQCPSYFGSPAWGNQECPSYFGSPAWGNQECPSCFGYHIRPIEGQGKKGKGRERKGLAGLAGLWGEQPPRNGVQCLRFEGVRREAMNAEISSPSFHPHPILGCSCMHVFFFGVTNASQRWIDQFQRVPNIPNIHNIRKVRNLPNVQNIANVQKFKRPPKSLQGCEAKRCAVFQFGAAAACPAGAFFSKSEFKGISQHKPNKKKSFRRRVFQYSEIFGQSATPGCEVVNCKCVLVYDCECNKSTSTAKKSNEATGAFVIKYHEQPDQNNPLGHFNEKRDFLHNDVEKPIRHM